jgi:hypothetical protein
MSMRTIGVFCDAFYSQRSLVKAPASLHPHIEVEGPKTSEQMRALTHPLWKVSGLLSLLVLGEAPWLDASA